MSSFSLPRLYLNAELVSEKWRHIDQSWGIVESELLDLFLFLAQVFHHLAV